MARAAILTFGFSGIVAQTVLLRELLAAFGGNEQLVGVLFGCWIAGEAAGGILCGTWKIPPRIRQRLFPIGAFIFCVSLPLAIYAIRLFRHSFGIFPDISLTLPQLLSCCCMSLLPVSIIHGALFILACALLPPEEGMPRAQSAGQTYLLDTLGTIAGGIAATYLLLPLLDPFQICIALTGLNALVCIPLLYAAENNPAPTLFRWFAILTALLSCTALLTNAASLLQKHSLSLQWSGKNLVASRNSVYQNIAVVKSENQYTFYASGLPLLTTPVPDTVFVEECAHLPLLAHPSPQRVLVLGGGAGGVIGEILRHQQVKQIDYVEQDPLLLRTIRDFPAPLTEQELSDPRVHLVEQDSRRFINTATDSYDLILLSGGPPTSLQSNRLFTLESLERAKKLLNPGGILLMTAPGSLTYYGPQLKQLSLSLHATLAKAFPSVFVVPGDTTFFMASTAPVNYDPSLLSKRLAERHISSFLLTPDYLSYRLDPERRRWYDESLKGAQILINRDFQPESLLASLAYRASVASPEAGSLSLWGRKVSAAALFLVTTLLCLTLLVILFLRPQTVPAVVICAAGFCSMVLQLCAFCVFQVCFGSIYQSAGILMAVFMGGIAVGSRITLSQRLDDTRSLSTVMAGILILALILFVAASTASPLLSAGGTAATVFVLSLLFLTGICTGAPFMPTIRLHAGYAGCETARSVGIVNFADLAGGFCAGILGGVLLIPSLGIANASLLLAIIALSSLIALFIYTRNG